MAGGMKSDRQFVCGVDQIANTQNNYCAGQLSPSTKGTSPLFAFANSFGL